MRTWRSIMPRRNGSGRAFIFTPSLRKEAIERRRVDAELHRAVEENQFELFYQPQVRITDGALVGAEALIRWNHPERGCLTPAHFLPVLEEGRWPGRWGTGGGDGMRTDGEMAAGWSALFPDRREPVCRAVHDAGSGIAIDADAGAAQTAAADAGAGDHGEYHPQS